jgi:membrane fusion protein (multidrug efflux system)
MKTTVLSLSALFLAFLAACSPEGAAPVAEAPSLPVVTVSSGNTNLFTEYPATIEGESEVQIRPQVGGILDKIFVDEGALVSTGQILFRINDRTYREQVNSAKAELLSAQAAAQNAKLEVSKIQPLVENKVVAEPQLKTAEANLSMANARIKQAQSLLADAEINLGYTTIKATAPGYIGRLNKKPGSLLSTSDIEELTTLSNIKTVRVYFSLSEQEFSKLKEGLPGNAIEEKLKNAKSVGLILSGKEEYAESGKLDMVNGAFNKNSGAITIRATFSNEHGLLRSGNTGKIRIGFFHENVVSVPQSATTEIQDKIFVYAVGEGNKVRKQPITVSGTSGNNYIVSRGIKRGERIVTEGIEGLQDGTVIRPTVKPVTVAQVIN